MCYKYYVFLIQKFFFSFRKGVSWSDKPNQDDGSLNSSKRFLVCLYIQINNKFKNLVCNIIE